MYADEDRRRLYETRHDIGASDNPEGLTADAAMQAAMASSRSDLQQARAALLGAAAGAAVEKTETDAKRLKLSQAIAAVIARYGYIRGNVRERLLNVDPATPVSAAELERRHKLVQRVFRPAASDLERLGQGQVIETLGGVAAALSTEPDLSALGHGPSLTAAHQAAEAAASDLDVEINEDAEAMTVLRRARADVDRVATAHALLVESVLVRGGRRDELGRYVLAEDPAYAARRAARTPIAEEPGIGDVDAEQPAAPPA